jgi:hypothetical protein
MPDQIRMQYPRAFSNFQWALGLALGAAFLITANGRSATSNPGVYISEFMASNSGKSAISLYDELGENPDWIELFNASDTEADLTGWGLTDNAKIPRKWPFPPTLLPAKNFLIIFASGRNTNVANQLHTNFKLAADGGYLALSDSTGAIVSEFAPLYPPQYPDVSYGRDRLDPSLVGFFVSPTPGAPNGTCGAGFGPEVQFSKASGTFLADFALALSITDTNFDIRYLLVTNNVSFNTPALVNIPTSSSPLYTSPLAINNTVQVRARAFPKQGNFFPGPPHTESYVKLTEAAASFTSDLPIMLFHNLGGGSIPMAWGESIRQNAILMVFEPANGRASLTNAPTLVTRLGWHGRGRITAGMPQTPMSLEFWDEFNEDKKQEFLGLPADSDWVLYAPDMMDASLIRNPFLHQLSRDIGRYSSRTRFAECFLNTKGGPVTFTAPAGGDYFGFYTIEEKIKHGKERVNIKRLGPHDTNDVTVSGGYLLKIDSYSGDESIFRDPYVKMDIVFVEPPGLDITDPARRPQHDYITRYFSSFGVALWGSDYTNPRTGYAAYIDVDSWVDHHLLECFAQNVDAFRLSGYFFKDRDKRIEMGPLWDLHLSMAGDARQWCGRSTDFFGQISGTEEGVNWWGRLFTDLEFWQKWIDRWTYLRRDVMTTNHIFALMDNLGNQLTNAAPREAKRWSNAGSSYQREIGSLKTWAATRINFIDTNLLSAPVFSRAGGGVNSGDALTITASTREANSTIYYTLDGSDPRLPGGFVSPLALSNRNSVEITLTNHVSIFARNYNAAHRNRTGSRMPPVSSSWSGPTVGSFVVTNGVCIDRVSISGTNCVIEFTAVTGFIYGVEKLDHLGQTNAWTTLRDQIMGQDETVTVTDPLRPGGRFYRLKAIRNQ